MISGTSIFKSRVAKRFFILFLVSAIVPIGIFSYLSYTQVSSQLKEQSLARLQYSAKSYGLILLERFSFLESELDIYGATALFSLGGNKIKPDNSSLQKRIQNHFISIAFISNTGDLTDLTDSITTSIPPELVVLCKESRSNDPLFYYHRENRETARIFLAKQYNTQNGRTGFLTGEISSTYLWGIGYENILPPMTEASVMDNNRNILFTSFEIPPGILHQIRFSSDNQKSRYIEYEADNRGYFIAYWPLFLKSKYEGVNLIVVLRNMQENVFAPLSNFKVLFPLVTLFAFWIVLLFTAVSIRRSMVPLEKLKEGAIKLAQKDFNTRVNIKTGDEFEALAAAFNNSAESLGRQFYAMESMAEIDRAVHSTLNTKNIIVTTLKRMFPFFSCDSILLGLIDSRKTGIMRVFTCTEKNCDTLKEDFIKITQEDTEKFLKPFDFFLMDIKGVPPSFVPDNFHIDFTHMLILPVFYNTSVNGIICLGHKNVHGYSPDDISHAQRLSSQVSAALSNAFLVEELETLNWGTLEALARTVDAKSKWTAGHSERVAKMCVKIAKVMGLDSKLINILHRGAYLHDIGKIGISLQIIDKPGTLTDEEYEIIKDHPSIGAKIIEPIEAYEDALPIILQHHEHFDGKGYPEGLSGQDISIGARILAVADVYDALVSNRPYRQGWVEDKVIDVITGESGTHFDPDVVNAFLTAISWSSTDNRSNEM